MPRDYVYYSYAVQCWVAATDCDWQFSSTKFVSDSDADEYRCVNLRGEILHLTFPWNIRDL